MITRRAFVDGVAAGVLLASLPARSQQTTKVVRIGWIASTEQANPRLADAFIEQLRELGYVQGRNVAIGYYVLDDKRDAVARLTADLSARNVDVIVSVATQATVSAVRATNVVPIVFVAVGDPLTSGVVGSLARPGGNATGFALLFPELVGKCLQQLKQAAPGMSRVAALWQPGATPGASEKQYIGEIDDAARALGVRLNFVDARSPADLDAAFAKMVEAKTQALTVLSTPMFAAARNRIANLALNNRLLTVFQFRQYVEAGGLMSYGPDLPQMFRGAAIYVHKILRGAKPGDLPVEQPAKFELVINLATAKTLGLAIPGSLLARADDVLE